MLLLNSLYVRALRCTEKKFSSVFQHNVELDGDKEKIQRCIAALL